MQNAWRSYLELAAGLSEASRRRATEVVRRLGSRSGATVEQLQQVAGDLTETTMNRDALVTVVRSELDRALAAVGLARADEVAQLAGRVEQLEKRLSETGSVKAGGGRPGATTARSGAATRSTSRSRTSGGTTRTRTVTAGHGTDGTASNRAGAASSAAKRQANSSAAPAAKRAARRPRSGAQQGSEEHDAQRSAPGREEP